MAPWQFVDELPSSAGGGQYAHYEHREIRASGWTACDARAIIQRHQDRWIDAFDEWHAELCRAAMARSPWWWLMPVSRPNLLAQHALLKPLFFAAAVCEWRADHPTREPFTLVGCPPQVRVYLEEFDGEERRSEGGCRRGESHGKTLVRELAMAWAGLAHALPHSVRRASPCRGRVLFYSHIVHLAPLQETGDHFFGHMIQAAESAMPGDVVTGYLVHDGVDRAHAGRILQRLGRRFTFFLDYLTVWDACWAAATGFRVCRVLTNLHEIVPPIRLGRWSSRDFVRRYVASTIAGQPPVLELAIYRAMRRLLRQAGIRVVVYPYEEKALERALLRACSETSPPVRAMGYTHSVLTRTHLALRRRPDGLPNSPQPSRLLSSGQQTTEFLVRWGRRRSSDVVTVGSHRHTTLLSSARPMTARQKGLRILAAIGPAYELSLLASYFERRPDLGAHDEVLIRAYPYTWKAEQDRDMARLALTSPHVKVAMGKLEDQLAWCDVVLFSATSIGLEAMLAGRLAIYLQLHDMCEADPLLGSRACFARCATADELDQALRSARELTDLEHAEWVRIQREFAVTVFGPVDREWFIAQLRSSASLSGGSEDHRLENEQPREILTAAVPGSPS